MWKTRIPLDTKRKMVSCGISNFFFFFFIKKLNWSLINGYCYKELCGLCPKILPHGEKRRFLKEHELVSSKSSLVDSWAWEIFIVMRWEFLFISVRELLGIRGFSNCELVCMMFVRGFVFVCECCLCELWVVWLVE